MGIIFILLGIIGLFIGLIIGPIGFVICSFLKKKIFWLILILSIIAVCVVLFLFGMHSWSCVTEPGAGAPKGSDYENVMIAMFSWGTSIGLLIGSLVSGLIIFIKTMAQSKKHN